MKRKYPYMLHKRFGGLVKYTEEYLKYPIKCHIEYRDEVRYTDVPTLLEENSILEKRNIKSGGLYYCKDNHIIIFKCEEPQHEYLLLCHELIHYFQFKIWKTLVYKKDRIYYKDKIDMGPLNDRLHEKEANNKGVDLFMKYTNHINNVKIK